MNQKNSFAIICLLYSMSLPAQNLSIKLHGVRRDGSGKFPPVPLDINKPLYSPENKKAIEDARFPSDFNKRTAIQPATNGFRM